MTTKSATAKVSPAAIAAIKKARAEGRQLFFNVGDVRPAFDRDGRTQVASYYPAPYTVVIIYDDGDVEQDFWGEDDGVEAAIEARLDAWASEQQVIEDDARRPVRAPYDTLEANCVANETLPSIAFRGGGPGSGGCSLKFKAEVMSKHLVGRTHGKHKDPGWAPLHAARAAGVKVVRLIGYDSSPRDTKRRTQCDEKVSINQNAYDHFHYRYPLQEWGWTRERCVEEIQRAGLTVPDKSACFFCPASKKHEIATLAAEHPELFLRAIAMEDRAAAGKHGLKPKRGLGINFRWRTWAEQVGILGGFGVVDPDGIDRVQAEHLAAILRRDERDLVQIGRAT